MSGPGIMAPETVSALGTALVHSLWQCALVAAGLSLALLAIRRSASQARYLVSCAALMAMVALPAATFFSYQRPIVSAVGASGFVVPNEASTAELDAALSPSTTGDEAARLSLPSGAVAWPMRMTALFRDPANLLRGAVAVWLVGVALLSIRLIGGWWLMRRMVRTRVIPVSDELKARAVELARRLRISRPVQLCESLLVEVPTVVGWLRPVILVPASTLTGLTPNQLQAVLAHELAHVRRHDYLVNLAQAVIETLLFYHPAVWWVSRTIREEREHCCDDIAITLVGDAVAYARALCELEECRTSQPSLALAATGGSLVNRVRRILGRPSYDTSATSRWLAGALAMAAVVMVVAAPTLQARMHRDAPKTTEEWATVSNEGASDETTPVESEACTDACTDEAKSAESACDAKAKSDADEAESAEADAVEAEAAEAEAIAATPAVPAVPATPAPWPVVLAPRAPRAVATPRPAAAPQPTPFIQLKARALAGLVDALKPAVKTLAEAQEALMQNRIEVIEPSQVVVTPVVPIRVQRELSSRDRQRLARKGIDEATANELKDLIGAVDVDELVSLHNAGVGADYVRELSDLGYPGVSVEDIKTLAQSGVSSEWVAAMQFLGYDHLEVSEMIQLAHAGIDAESVSQLRALGYRNVPVEDLIRLAHSGVEAKDVAAYRAAGLRNLAIDDLIRLAQSGVDPEFVAVTRALDYSFSTDDLIRLGNSGVDSDYISEIANAGGRGLDADELIQLHNSGVDGDTVRILNVKRRR